MVWGSSPPYPHQTRPSDLIIKVILTFAEKDSILIQDREKRMLIKCLK